MQCAAEKISRHHAGDPTCQQNHKKCPDQNPSPMFVYL
jgi:hypothetical protein